MADISDIRLTLRKDKPTHLTIEEVDNNFTGLKSAIGVTRDSIVSTQSDLDAFKIKEQADIDALAAKEEADIQEIQDSLIEPFPGHWWNNGILRVHTNGNTKIGKSLHLHSTSDTTGDYDVSLYSSKESVSTPIDTATIDFLRGVQTYVGLSSPTYFVGGSNYISNTGANTVYVGAYPYWIFNWIEYDSSTRLTYRCIYTGSQNLYQLSQTSLFSQIPFSDFHWEPLPNVLTDFNWSGIASLPAVGQANTYYVDGYLNIYYWTGTSYFKVSKARSSEPIIAPTKTVDSFNILSSSSKAVGSSNVTYPSVKMDLTGGNFTFATSATSPNDNVFSIDNNNNNLLVVKSDGKIYASSSMSVTDANQLATKAYVDSKSGSGGSVDLSNYYTKSQVDSKIPSLTNYYTKSEVDSKIPSLTNYYTKSEVYNKGEVDAKLIGLGGGGGGSVDLTNYYTKSQVDGKFLNTRTTTYSSGYCAAYINDISDTVTAHTSSIFSISSIYQYQSSNDSAITTKSLVAKGDVSAGGLTSTSGGLYGSAGLFFGVNAIKGFGRFYGNGVALAGAYNLFATLTITTWAGSWVYVIKLAYAVGSNSIVTASCSGDYFVNCSMVDSTTLWVNFKNPVGTNAKLPDDQTCSIILV